MARKVDDVIRDISANREKLVALKVEINSNEMLTEQGKRTQLQEAIDAAQARHRELRAEYSEAVRAEHDELYRRAFQMGAGRLCRPIQG